MRALLAAAAVVWTALLPGGAYAAGQPGGGWQSLAVAVYGLGAAICHQRADRSFHLGATQLPVCARCAGIYAGAAIGALSTLWLRRDVRRTRTLLALAAAPAALSLLYEWTTGDVPSNEIRASTGVVLGGAVAYLVLHRVN